jgi:hypothetical protein
VQNTITVLELTKPLNPTCKKEELEKRDGEPGNCSSGDFDLNVFGEFDYGIEISDGCSKIGSAWFSMIDLQFFTNNLTMDNLKKKSDTINLGKFKVYFEPNGSFTTRSKH